MEKLRNHTFLVTGLVLATTFAGYFAYEKFFGDAYPKEVVEIVQEMRGGDHKEAREKYLAALNDPATSADTKAFALYVSLGAGYRSTDDKEARIEEIQDMKSFIIDPSIMITTRVNLLNTLANYAYSYGSSPKISHEVFKDEPFATFSVEGDHGQSAKNLAVWSYELKPTSNAAILIARWYTEEAAANTSLDPSVRSEYIKLGEEFLEKADAANSIEVENDPDYEKYRQYVMYRYWRTIVISRLSVLVGDPYSSRYRGELEEFIAFADSSGGLVATERAMFARLHYAIKSQKDSDTKNVAALLAKLTDSMRNTEKPNTFFDFLFNEYVNNPEGPVWTGVKSLSSESEEFKVAVENVIGGPTE